MNKIDNRKRYAIVMAIGILCNIGFFIMANYFKWPMWLDSTGTVLVALTLEPAAGLLVALAGNFFVSAFVFDASNMVYYALGAASALIVGVGMKRNGKLAFKNILWVVPAVLMAGTALDYLITLWHGGVPSSLTEQIYYSRMLGKGYNGYLACFVAIVVVKAADTVITTLFTVAAYTLLPKRLKYDLSGTGKK